MSDPIESNPPEKYAVLPPRTRREDLLTAQEVRPQPAEKSEFDRQTELGG